MQLGWVETYNGGAHARDPSRTLLGDEQERWLVDGMATTAGTWNVIAQQSKVTESDDTVGPGESYPNDNWDGYAGARVRLFDAVHERGVRNMVVVSGDAHVSMASDLKPRFKDPAQPGRRRRVPRHIDHLGR